jgi:hypothetical protein
METMTRRTVSTAALVLDEVVLRALRFPLWWYSRGFVEVGRSLLGAEQGWVDRLGLRILLTNMFVPMFGDYTRSGRIISFFIRVALLIGKGIFVAVISVILLATFVAYLLLPIAVTVQLIYQFGGPLLLR